MGKSDSFGSFNPRIDPDAPIPSPSPPPTFFVFFNSTLSHTHSLSSNRYSAVSLYNPQYTLKHPLSISLTFSILTFRRNPMVLMRGPCRGLFM